ncbi:MAG: alcohol dehydrogenase catalytic domain-containing protein [Acidimicrobiia bacterium]
MRALVFGGSSDPADTDPPDASLSGSDNPRVRNLASTPMALTQVDDLTPRADDWVVLSPRLTGVCGSDAKQVFMDTDGDASDFSLTAFISFPQVLGHEVVADVTQVGDAVSSVSVGDRVVLNCWLSCAPRGIDPVCPACAAGDLSLCWNFTSGSLAPGIHSGNSSDGPGGFADAMPAHESMCVPVPDGVSDEAAVLADPFAVSLHAVARHPPPNGGRALVWGAGALGLTTVAILAALHPDVDVHCVALHAAQQDLARHFGATVVDAAEDAETIVRRLADDTGAVLHQPWKGLPVAHPGTIDITYDTVGKPATLETALRLMVARGTIAVTGVSAAGRFEWSPWYFKEVDIVGSNAFGVEEVDGVRRHALEHYLDLVSSGRIDVTPMLTHTFRLDEWRDAFRALADQHDTGAVKVAFDLRPPTDGTPA